MTTGMLTIPQEKTPATSGGTKPQPPSPPSPKPLPTSGFDYFAFCPYGYLY